MGPQLSAEKHASASSQGKDLTLPQQPEEITSPNTDISCKKCVSLLKDRPREQLLLEHMKKEVRKLYGQKVNMENTNYILKPYEFKCIAQTISRKLGQSGKEIKTVDDLLYAIDCLCNNKPDQTDSTHAPDSASQQSPSSPSIAAEETAATLQALNDSLRALVCSEREKEEKAEHKPASSLPEVLQSLQLSIDSLKHMLQEKGCSTLEQALAEKEQLKRDMQGVSRIFGLASDEHILDALVVLRTRENEEYEKVFAQKEQSISCQRKHYEQTVSSLNTKMVELSIENKKLRHILSEKYDLTDQVAKHNAALEENIKEIRAALHEEEQKINERKTEYAQVRKILVEQNKKMAKIVSALTLQIKKEKQEKRELEILVEEAAEPPQSLESK